VLAEIGASDVPEIIVVNKADVADPITLKTLQTREPRSVVVSARTGAGIGELREVLEAALPQPDVPVEVLVPYERGDLVSRVHSEGTVDRLDHTPDGTLLAARVHGDLAGELAPYDVTPTHR
jgi:GTPase